MRTLFLLCVLLGAMSRLFTLALNILTPSSIVLKSELVIFKSTQGTSRYAVALTWGAANYNEHFVVLRSTVQGGYYQQVSKELILGEFIDLEADRGKTYYYVISEIYNDNDEETDRSNEVKVVIP